MLYSGNYYRDSVMLDGVACHRRKEEDTMVRALQNSILDVLKLSSWRSEWREGLSVDYAWSDISSTRKRRSRKNGSDGEKQA